MLAVHTVRVLEMGIGETAADLMRFERRARKWPERFDAGGLDGLLDLPRTGPGLQGCRARSWHG